MKKKRTPSETVAEAARLESKAHQLHKMVDATHKAARNMRLRATAARKKAQQASRQAKAQVVKAADQTNRVHKTEETGDAVHQKIRKSS
jgi:hypothetical protein